MQTVKERSRLGRKNRFMNGGSLPRFWRLLCVGLGTAYTEPKKQPRTHKGIDPKSQVHVWADMTLPSPVLNPDFRQYFSDGQNPATTEDGAGYCHLQQRRCATICGGFWTHVVGIENQPTPPLCVFLNQLLHPPGSVEIAIQAVGPEQVQIDFRSVETWNNASRAG